MATSSDTQNRNESIVSIDDSFTTRRKQASLLDKSLDTLVEINGEYVNLEEENGYYARYIRRYPGSSLYQIYDSIIEEYNYLFVHDIVMSYVKYIGLNNIKKSDVDGDNFYLDQFNDIDKNRKYDNIEVLTNIFDKWEKVRNNKKTKNNEYTDIINIIQEDVFKVIKDTEENNEKVVSTNFTVTNVSVVINPLSSTGEDISIVDGLNIFNNSVASRRIPYIKYNDGDKSYYKVYKGDSLSDIPNYDNIDLLDKLSNVPDIIYAQLWVDKDGLLSKAAKKDFIKLTFNLKFNRITFTLPEVMKNIDENEAIEYLRLTFPDLDMRRVVKEDIKGTFDMFFMNTDNSQMFNLLFDEFTLVDSITYGLELNRPDKEELTVDESKYLLGAYLYLDEIDKPNADKTSLKLNYRSLTSNLGMNNVLLKDVRATSDAKIPLISKVNFELINDTSIGGEEFFIEDTNELISLSKDINYIHVRVNAKTEEDLNIFIKIIKILLYIYIILKDDVYDEYLDIFGQEFIDKLLYYQKKYKHDLNEEKEDSKTKKLKKLASDIFVSGYPALCSNPPIAITEDEIDYWKNQKVTVSYTTNDGTKVKRQKQRKVLSFPSENPKYHFVCEGNNNPYIDTLKNTLSNKSEYPRLPCCYQTEHPNISVSDVKGAKNKGMIKGKFILLPGQYGELPIHINDLLKLYSNKTVKFYRFGVIRSSNSMIHCLCKGTSDAKYLELEKIEDPEERNEALEKHVSLIRASFVEMIDVFKQEIYDKTDEQIKEAILDNTIFLDPKLFYRGLEEIFGLNIFTFIPDSETSDDGDIEVPRSWLFHISSYRPERKTIIIYKHLGSKRDSAEFPQCELIVQGAADGHVSIFEDKMYEVCYEILSNQTSTITWSSDKGNNIEGNINVYSSMNYNEYIDYSAYKQYIDEHGKCRCLIFQVSIEDKLYDISMITPPSQPENLPRINSIDELYKSHYTIATSIFGDFTKVDVSDDNIVGLWFKILDIDQGIYIPIYPVSTAELNVTEEMIGDSNPIFGTQVSKTNRYSVLKRDITIFLEILKWFYEIYKLENNIPDGNKEDFFINYIAEDNHRGDSMGYYDFSKVEHRLPFFDNVEDALNYISSISKGMIIVKDDKKYISTYNDLFHGKIWKYLIEYNEHTEGLKGNPQKYISEYFQSVNNFNTKEDTILFLGSKSYHEWLERIIYGPFKLFNINNGITLNKSKLVTPYLFKFKNKYYIIQNVIRGVYAKAVKLAVNWFYNRINLGFNPDDAVVDEQNNFEIIMFGVTKNETLDQIYTSGTDIPDVLEILQYGIISSNNVAGEVRYAAMLPLN